MSSMFFLVVLCSPSLILPLRPSLSLSLSLFLACSAGYYSTNVTPDLKVIAVETNYCYMDNWWLLLNSTDPGHELNWLIKELLQSEKIGQKVHIIGHIPPYSTDCLPSWSYNYFKIASR